MISYISGKIINKTEFSIVLENNGIGYKIFTTPKVLEISIGSNAALYTYLHVREDALVLFGFENLDDLNFFELLITVNGVGPKMALSILSAGSSDLVKQAIVAQDAAIFTKIGGVGKKTAEKIILELKEKVASISNVSVHAKSDDLLDALEALGYSDREIKDILPQIDYALPVEDKIRQALKFLGNRK